MLRRGVGVGVGPKSPPRRSPPTPGGGGGGWWVRRGGGAAGGTRAGMAGEGQRRHACQGAERQQRHNPNKAATRRAWARCQNATLRHETPHRADERKAGGRRI